MTKHWTVLATASLATLLALFAPAPVARADIFEWEYINPANPSLGKQRSTTLAPEGAGANAEPGTNLSSLNLTKAYLSGANVSTYLVYDGQYGYVDSYVASNLTAVNLSQADLVNANFRGVAGYNVNEEFTYYPGADLTDANLFQANATNANFILASLNGANLRAANLTSAVFNGATLTGANFNNAGIQGADFAASGVKAAQIYSTASYQAHDLTEIGLSGNNLAGVNLAGQNLTNARFTLATLTNANLSQANLTNANFTVDTGSANSTAADVSGANLSGANLTNANFAGEDWCGENGCGTSPGANLANTNLSGADARGATFEYATLSGANTTNLIQSDGHIAGLGLTAGDSLVVRDYDGNPTAEPTPIGPLPIVVDGHLATDGTGTLRLVFDADPWDSTISFAPGIPVTRGGALELTFASDVNLASQVGRTMDLFDWTGVSPTGTFSISSPYTWNVSNLYTTGEVTLTAAPGIVPGDFNGNGTVDAADYIVWRKSDGTPAGYNAWRTHFGQSAGSGADTISNAAIPEPSVLVLLGLAAACRCRWRRRAV